MLSDVSLLSMATVRLEENCFSFPFSKPVQCESFSFYSEHKSIFIEFVKAFFARDLWRKIAMEGFKVWVWKQFPVEAFSLFLFYRSLLLFETMKYL